MTIVKSYIELTPDAGDLYTATLSPKKKTGLAAYVIDGSFNTSLSAPDMSGQDFQQMKDAAFRREFSDLVKQPSPFFYFTKSKTFCMNMVSPYLAACFSTPSAAAGLFQPTVVELHKTKGTSAIGEIDYSGTAVYITMPAMTRGSVAVSTHIKNGSTIIARPSDYNYDIDSKTATKSVSISSSGWTFGVNNPRTAITIDSTSEYVFKYSKESGKISTVSCNSLTADDSETAVVFRGDSNSGYASAMGVGSTGYPLKKTSSSHLLNSSVLSSKLNISSAEFDSPNYSFIISKVLTPQVISTTNASYLCQTVNPYGLGDIFTVDTSTSTLKPSGSSYTAIGECKALVSGSPTTTLYNLGIRVVANKDSLSGKTSIIKSRSGEGVTVSSELTCYKIAVASSYSVLKSGSDNPQEDQSYAYCFQVAAQKLIHAGYLQCVTDKNNQALSDSYDVGVMMLGMSLVNATTISAKIYVLYDDNSVAISSYNITITDSGNVCPVKISADGKNIVAYRPYMTKGYAGAPGVRFTSIVSGLPADDSFIVPDNSSNSRKIEAVGVVFESGTAFNSSFHPQGNRTNGTYLILEPKT